MTAHEIKTYLAIAAPSIQVYKEDENNFYKSMQEAIEYIDAINELQDLLEGTIYHFDLEDAMDTLYQAKEILEVLKNG